MLLRALYVVLTALCVLAAGCASSADDRPAVTATVDGPRATASSDRGFCALAEAYCQDPGSLQRALVVKIIDGDTLDVQVDGREERVRIFGIDTAERGERCFSEARARLAALAAGTVRLMPDVRERDPGGRLLRYVYTDGGVSIDALLIAEGLAVAWTRDGALRDALVALEAGARDARGGCLWGG